MVADVIRSQIVDGTLPTRCSRSRTNSSHSQACSATGSFREALRILDSEGLVSVREGT